MTSACTITSEIVNWHSLRLTNMKKSRRGFIIGVELELEGDLLLGIFIMLYII